MTHMMDRETFLKGQLEAVSKALTKQEVPLKPKHARRLILGTHHDHSCGVFWNAVNRVQLEKNPVLTWKFAHLLHKLMRDGYKKVPEESHRFIPKIRQLSQFWQHLHTSGYGVCNESYCKLIIDRLDFHKKNPAIPGSLQLNENQLKALQADLDSSFDITCEMLDQMDNLLDLQSKVYDTMESLRWSSLVPQGQTLLAPLIIVVLDSSKFYDFLVKMLFKLHSQIPPDVLAGHRDRFNVIFRRTKKFYEESSNLQYFKFLVSIPTLPATAPNFLQASDLDSYQTPQAYLHSDGASEADDSRSVLEMTGAASLVDLDEPVQLQQPSPASSVEANRDAERVLMLERAVEDERMAKERLVAEARSRIEQYENRLAQVHAEMEHARREADEHRGEAERLQGELSARDSARASSDDARVREMEGRAKAAEERFGKMKSVYERFRQEHVSVLGKLGELQKQLQESEKLRMDKEQELVAVSRRCEESSLQQKSAADRAASDAAAVDELRGQLARADLEMEGVRREMDTLRGEHEKREDERRRERDGEVAAACVHMMDKCGEELDNATSVSYPPHLAQSAVSSVAAQVVSLSASSPARERVLTAHALAGTVMAAASAAYSASIQHYDGVNDACVRVVSAARSAFADPSADPSSLVDAVSQLNGLMQALPLQTDVDKDVVGSELEEEMRRMDEAIRQAVGQIEEIQRKAREQTDGVRLEVNEKVLECCQALMTAIQMLVARSRELQNEIVAAGKSGASPAEFYKRNHQWTEGLLSAAKAVGVAARVLVTAADTAVGGGKLEPLIVAAQEIAACTAQLFVSSRVKADRESQKLAALSEAAKLVNQSTAQVVASAKSGQNTLNDQVSLDFSHLTLHEAKKEEMESQVRMLELEQALTQERAKLARLRKQHYHMASLVAAERDGKKEAEPFEMIG